MLQVIFFYDDLIILVLFTACVDIGYKLPHPTSPCHYLECVINMPRGVLATQVRQCAPGSSVPAGYPAGFNNPCIIYDARCDNGPPGNKAHLITQLLRMMGMFTGFICKIHCTNVPLILGSSYLILAGAVGKVWLFWGPRLIYFSDLELGEGGEFVFMPYWQTFVTNQMS